MRRFCPLPLILTLLFALAGCQEASSLYDFDGDGSLDEDDCDSTDASVYPGAPVSPAPPP